MGAVIPGIYFGKVIHRRLRPVPHHLEYNVASLLVDVDRLDQLPALIARNRFGLFGLYDKDHGEKGKEQSIAAFAWNEMRKQQGSQPVARIMMLAYPRMLGYTFNPLTVYFGLDADEQLRVVVYEVHNTFGGRHIYTAGPFEPGEAAFASSEKLFRVSPFNKIEGHYGLRVTQPTERIAVAVSLTTAEGPLLNAYFTGQRQPLSNRVLLRVLAGFPFMTLKVLAGIHWEALKLWRKGLKLQGP
jgi:DUF1365 family protein